jgi:ribosomal protein S18 acetylase RimI-like enzyme
MIRPTTPGDAAGLIELAVTSGLFPPDGTEELAGVLAGYLDGSLGPDHFWVTDDESGPVGVAYYAPERMTEGTWNLYMIAVRPDRQRQGRGAALLRHVEQALTARGGRLLLVETSGLASFERTRAFYRKCGYDEEARIRDFYKAGEDKVVFRKALSAPGP